ncbi:MAG: hydantoinase/oxoprolinase family protein [Eggerthellaceae bacterium]|nr:hydantoinase/oxoprolinase family protein [Eggerthellaceae bacterium]
MIGIGIDTGGTYTDAVVVDTDSGKVFAKAKSLTTKENLAVGIGRALDALPAEARGRAHAISLSTTLATNACVEGKGGRAKLVIVGVDEGALHRLNVDRVYGIPHSDVLAVDAAVDPTGRSVEQPDWDTICSEHADFFADADSFGIAGVHALNNGGAMERFGASYLERRYGTFVVQAIDVATEVNVYERAATALLNARLVPVIREFLDAIADALRERAMDGMPVSVVRSDGSLMSAQLARSRPVETILSGPAASVRGAQVLHPASEALVVDIGGTTSDVALFHDGQPVMTDHIRIGGWKTQVPGIAIDTIGLGGDSAARYTKEGSLVLLPERVLPFCIAAARWPQVAKGLELYLGSATPDHLARYEFYCLVNEPTAKERYTSAEQKFISLLANGPVSLNDARSHVRFLDTTRLEAEGVVVRSGMTPTDAMHVLGMLDTFDARASELGARCLLKSYRKAHVARAEKSIEQLATEICDLARKKLYEQAGRVLLAQSYEMDAANALDGPMKNVFDGNWERRRTNEPPVEELVQSSGTAAAVNGDPAKGARPPKSAILPAGEGTVADACPAAAAFSLLPHTEAVLIGIGAPTHVFLPYAAQALGAQWAVPEHAEVANAVGAACAQVMVNVKVRVKPVRGAYGIIEGYRIFSSEESTFVPAEKLDDADGTAEQKAKQMARDAARRIVQAEAQRRGTSSGVDCAITEEETSFTGAADGQTVVYEWVFTAHVE